MEKHLKDNKLTGRRQVPRGPQAEVRSEAETFIGDKDADALLTREYRKGFEVPAKA